MSDQEEEIQTGIHVSFRARPLNAKEIEEGQRMVVHPGLEPGTLSLDRFEDSNNCGTSRHQTEKNYKCDAYFGPEDDTRFIYNETAKNLITRITDGFNCSVFCYGSTGTGKTHTMFGTPEDPGIVSMLIEDLLKARKPGHEISISLSAIEVYGNEFRDLLLRRRDPSAGSSKRQSRPIEVQSVTGRLYGVTGTPITNLESALRMIEMAKSSRVTHSTKANDTSSRSHCVIQINTVMRGAYGETLRSKLNLIDLAGSERVNQTGLSAGIRLTEACNINSSLLALKKCISGLALGKDFIPFRDSNLTRLLQDCLEGCLTYFIACVSPASGQWQSTRDTLEYGSQARAIKMTAKSRYQPAMGLREQINFLKDANRDLVIRVRNAEKEAYKAEHYRKDLEREFKYKEEVANQELQRLRLDHDERKRALESDIDRRERALESEMRRREQAFRIEVRNEVEVLRRQAEAASTITEEQRKIIEYKEELQVQAEGKNCVICLDRLASHAFAPCGHRCICEGCVEPMKKARQKRCPICKQHYQLTLKIFM